MPATRKQVLSTLSLSISLTTSLLRGAVGRHLGDTGAILPDLQVFDDRVPFLVGQFRADHSFLGMPAVAGLELVAGIPIPRNRGIQPESVIRQGLRCVAHMHRVVLPPADEEFLIPLIRRK